MNIYMNEGATLARRQPGWPPPSHYRASNSWRRRRRRLYSPGAGIYPASPAVEACALATTPSAAAGATGPGGTPPPSAPRSRPVGAARPAAPTTTACHRDDVVHGPLEPEDQVQLAAVPLPPLPPAGATRRCQGIPGREGEGGRGAGIIRARPPPLSTPSPPHPFSLHILLPRALVPLRAL